MPERLVLDAEAFHRRVQSVDRISVFAGLVKRQPTSMLHRVEIARPKSVIGRTTTASLQSGLLYGYAGMVDAMVTRIREELGQEAPVIATGGLAQRIASESSTIERVEPFLTLEGLRMLFERNRSDRSEPLRKER